ncbi:MAG: type I-B CRISPR-associated protein Cas8b1/Cst1 [Chloroflexi bacterium]|nr:type I-B CRISPR-associated protein Cas8b1/Cst1 [Chloroflexota bacterium]
MIEMLKYTGHPLVDVGAATITAFAGKLHPGSLTEADLDKFADFIARQYVVDPLKSFLNVAFPNSGFTNPAFEKTPERRSAYAERVLRGYRSGLLEQADDKCVFTGEPAIGHSFSDKIEPGRSFRQHIPLITGEGVINFFPWGDAGVPVSGKAMLCIQAFPMGCAKCGGKLLAVHSDSPDLISEFAGEFLQHNLRALDLAHKAGSKKMPEAGASAKTLLVETLLKAEIQRRDEFAQRRPASVTAYHLTNSGQSNALDSRNPPLEIYHLPLELTGFLAEIVKPEFRAEWSALVQRAWRLPRPKKESKSESGGDDLDDRPRRNLLYEDLFRLPVNAQGFVRRYFLRLPFRTRFEDDPRRTYSLRQEADLASWKLTELFLRKVVNMDKERRDQIRDLGDRLAAYVKAQNERDFFSRFLESRYDFFRMRLMRANLDHVRRGNAPIIEFDPYVEVFEEGEEVAIPGWRLARDLVFIRMVEQLHQQGWIGSNPDAIPEVVDEAEASS